MMQYQYLRHFPSFVIDIFGNAIHLFVARCPEDGRRVDLRNALAERGQATTALHVLKTMNRHKAKDRRLIEFAERKNVNDAAYTGAV